MDELVRRAVEKWPNVPAVAGWLRLDRRGEWWIRMGEAEDAPFDRITSPALIAFIGRNYDRDDRGRYYFQNGPQRVYVALEYAPYVLRLDDTQGGLITHNDVVVRSIGAAFIDEEGSLVLNTDIGLGLVLDRDLERITDTLADTAGRAIDGEVLFDEIAAGRAFEGALLGERVWFRPVRKEDVARTGAFVAEPGV